MINQLIQKALNIFNYKYKIIMQNIFLVLLSIILPLTQSAVFDKVVVQDKDAVCLDGTPGVYYISRGKSPNKFMVYFEGGGWCGANTLDSTIQSCYQRSLGDLGSSKNYPANYTINDGILSQDPRNSFSDYTKIYFKYCDGSGHQGTRSLPVDYKGAKLYFRGSNLTISKLEHLEKTLGLFSKSTEIMVTGGSAGGLASFTWADYIKNKAQHGNVYSVPDSGIFLDSANFNSKQHEYRNGFVNIFKLANVQIDPPVPECVKAHITQKYKCMFAQYMIDHIQTPLFPVQSLYDSWCLPNIIGINCAKGLSLQSCSPEQLKYIEQYHKNNTIVFQRLAKKAANGYWAPVCVNHVYMWGALYSQDYTVPMHTNNTIDLTLVNWVLKRTGNHRYMDTGKWPDNKPCSGVASLQVE